MNVAILDMDGVIMDETPYWKTALATALSWHGLNAGSAAEWECLAAACLTGERVQRVTKLRECNSNWDLAAVLVRALDDATVRAEVAVRLRQKDWGAVARALRASADALYRGMAGTPPIAAFGIDRYGDFFEAVVRAFQDVYEQKSEMDWPYARQAPALSAVALRRALDDLRALGFSIGVCTSRDRDETVAPLEALEVLPCFAASRIVTADEVRSVEAATGIRPLQKPHWFPLVYAAADPGIALEAVRGGRLPAQNGAAVFVGDASADFECARASREAGLAVEYLHIDSGLTDDRSIQRIGTDPMTLGVVSDLEAAVRLLRGRYS